MLWLRAKSTVARQLLVFTPPVATVAANRIGEVLAHRDLRLGTPPSWTSRRSP